MTGQLFVVATPIGNLGDISFRAIAILRQVALIAAEDTRVSRKLLAHYGISTPMISCHEHNEARAGEKITATLQQGKDVALISDAGTPLISDPGYGLVRHLRQTGIAVSPIPGPCSPIAALSVSGLPTDRFSFLGFLPRSGRARQTALARIATADCTQVLMESTRRLRRTLEELLQVCGAEREACLAREMTKLHEDITCGTLESLYRNWQANRLRGEAIVVIAGAPPRQVTDEEIIRALQLPDVVGMPPSARAQKVAEALGIPRRRAYTLLLNTDAAE